MDRTLEIDLIRGQLLILITLIWFYFYFQKDNTTIRFMLLQWLELRILLFTYLEKGGRIWIWNWIWVKFGPNWKVFDVFFFNCLGMYPCYLIVVSGSFLSNNARRLLAYYLFCSTLSFAPQLESEVFQ